MPNSNDVVVDDDYNYYDVGDNSEDDDGDVHVHDVVQLHQVEIVDHDADGCL